MCGPSHKRLFTDWFSPSVTGVLKGYDQLMNLVLDEVEETIAGKSLYILKSLVLTVPSRSDPESGDRQRRIGLAVLRGPQITILSPVDGFAEIANPFAQEG